MDIKTIVKRKTDGVMGAVINAAVFEGKWVDPEDGIGGRAWMPAYSLLTVAWQSGEITTVREDEVESVMTPVVQTLKEKLKEEANART